MLKTILETLGFHRVHDIRWAYGWKVPTLNWARFDDHGWQRLTMFHDCTRTGIY